MTIEALNTSLQTKEQELLDKRNPLLNDSQSTDVVDEKIVKDKLTDIEKRIQESAVSDKYKKQIQDKLNKSVDDWKKKIDEVDVGVEDDFKKLFDEMVLEFDTFEQDEEVKTIITCIEPFFKNAENIKKIINLKTYGRMSGDWVKINSQLAIEGFDKDKIEKIQTMLNIVVDGKVGPETIMAINSQIYEEPKEVKWAGKTTHMTDTPEEFEKYATDADRAMADSEWQKIENTLDAELAVAKTIEDISKAEEKANQAKKALYERLKTLLTPEEKIDDSKEKIDIPDDFKAINQIVQIDEESIKAYHEAYMAIPEAQRLPVAEIVAKLTEIKDTYSTKLDETTLKNTLIEAFGKLVNGEKENLVNNSEILESINEAIGKEIAEKTKQLEEINQKINKIEEVKRKTFSTLGDATGNRGDWGVLFDSVLAGSIAGGFIGVNPDKDLSLDNSYQDIIDSSILMLERLASKLSTELENQGRLTDEISKLKSELYTNAYNVKSEKGENTDQILLSAHDDLGDKMPSDLKTRYDAFIKTYIDDPNTPEFDKLFYQGKYEEALELLRKQNADSPKTENSLFIGVHDVLAAYKAQRSSPTKSFADDTFAGKKIKEEGFVPVLVNDKSLPTKITRKVLENDGSQSEETIDVDNNQVYLVKENPDKSISYVQVNTDGSEMTHYKTGPYKGQNLSSEEVVAIEQKDEEMKANIKKLLTTSPSFRSLSGAASVIGKKLGPLQHLFESGMKGKKQENFVEYARKYAADLESSSAINDLKNNLGTAEKEFDQLRLFLRDQGFSDEFDVQIKNIQKSLQEVKEIVKNDVIGNLCRFIQSDDFSADTIGKWLIKTGIPMLTSIALAVAAVVITIESFGTLSGVGALLVTAAVGSAAGIVGHELGTVGSHYIGKAVYGEQFSNKTMLGQYLTNEEVFNPATQQWEKIKTGELVKVYGENFVVGFITTFALMGLGAAAGNVLAKFANVNTATSGLKGSAARLLSKIPKLGAKEIDLASKKGLGGFIKQLNQELLEELKEEGMESMADNIDSRFGFMIQFYNCLNGGPVRHKLGKYNVVLDSRSKVEGGMVSSFSFDSNQSEEVLGTLTKEYGAQGFTITKNVDGSITATSTMTLKKGGSISNTMIFKPSKDSIAIRQLLTDGRKIDENGKEGPSEIERLYGIKKVKDNVYTFDQDAPDGKLTFIGYLKKKGFVITGDTETGRFTARKGDEEVSFIKKGSKKSVKTEVLSDEERKLRKSDKQDIRNEMDQRERLLKDIDIRMSLSDVTNNELQRDLASIDTEIKKINDLISKHPKIMGKGENQAWRDLRTSLEQQKTSLEQRKVKIQGMIEARKPSARKAWDKVKTGYEKRRSDREAEKNERKKTKKGGTQEKEPLKVPKAEVHTDTQDKKPEDFKIKDKVRVKSAPAWGVEGWSIVEIKDGVAKVVSPKTPSGKQTMIEVKTIDLAGWNSAESIKQDVAEAERVRIENENRQREWEAKRPEREAAEKARRDEAERIKAEERREQERLKKQQEENDKRLDELVKKRGIPNFKVGDQVRLSEDGRLLTISLINDNGDLVVTEEIGGGRIRSRNIKPANLARWNSPQEIEERRSKKGGNSEGVDSKMDGEAIKSYIEKVKSDSSQPKLTRLILSNPMLTPTTTIKVGDRVFYAGPVIATKTEKGGLRFQSIMFTEVNGKLVPRAFYKSNSDNWRVTPYFAEIYSKGDKIHYTQETKPHETLSAYLGEQVVNQEYNGDFIQEYFGMMIADENGNKTFNDGLGETKTFSAEHSRYDDGGKLDGVRQFNPGRLNKDLKSRADLARLEKVTSVENLPDGFVPDFSGKPVRSYQMDHTILTPATGKKITVDVYQGVLDGKSVEWHMAHDSQGRVWVDRINFQNDKYNSYGVVSNLIHSGILTSKPIDYTVQIDRVLKYPILAGAFSDYSDITPLIDRMGPIKKFRQQRNIQHRNLHRLEFSDVARTQDIVAVPDTHGDFKAFNSTLEGHGLIDGRGTWIGGDTRIQILGDIFDRGPDAIKILKKIGDLKMQGARVDLLVGNHEDWMLNALLTEDRNALANWGRYADAEQRQAISSGRSAEYLAKYRDILEIYRSSKIIEQVDDVIYMHGELSIQGINLLEAYGSVDAINEVWQEAVGRAFDGDPSMLRQVSKDFHPFLWSRAISEGGKSDSGGQMLTATPEELIRIESVLKNAGVNIVVHGHTPQRDGVVGTTNLGSVKIMNADTALSAGMSESTPSAGGIKITKDAKLSIIDANNPYRKASS